MHEEDYEIIVLKPEVIDIKLPQELDIICSKSIGSTICEMNAQAVDNSSGVETQNINESFCEHYHINLQIRINIFSSIYCYLCCLTGIITAFIGIIFNRYCQIRYSSSLDNYNKLFLKKIYEIEDDKNLRFPLENDNQIQETIVDLKCVKLQKPHHFTIKCENCNKTLKSGYTQGSMKLALFCGIFGFLTFGLSLLSLYIL